MLKAIRLGLQLKFGSTGLRLYPEVCQLDDFNLLEAISEAIPGAATPEEIERLYKTEAA